MMITDTPIGKLYTGRPFVATVLDRMGTNQVLRYNKIVYPACLVSYGVTHFGYSFAATIPEELMDRVASVRNLLHSANDEEIVLFDPATGERIAGKHLDDLDVYNQNTRQ